MYFYAFNMFKKNLLIELNSISYALFTKFSRFLCVIFELKKRFFFKFFFIFVYTFFRQLFSLIRVFSFLFAFFLFFSRFFFNFRVLRVFYALFRMGYALVTGVFFYPGNRIEHNDYMILVKF